MNGACYSTIVNDWTEFNRADTQIHFPFFKSDLQIRKIKGTKYWDHYYSMAQAGFFAHLVPEHGDLVLGAPGFHHWTGSVIKIEESAQRKPYGDALIPNIYDDGRFEKNDYLGKLTK